VNREQKSKVQTLLRTTRFGDLPVDEQRIFTFEDGLPGFPEATRFLAMDVEDDPDLYWLQSVDDGALAFLAIVPWHHFPDYAPVLGGEDRIHLRLDDPDDAMVLCLLTVDHDSDVVTANLLGPVVLNLAGRIGRQVVLADADLPLAARLGAA
jgi:flagellar assembly factor FliW